MLINKGVAGQFLLLTASLAPSDKSALHCVTGDSTIPPPDAHDSDDSHKQKKRAHFEGPPFAHCHKFLMPCFWGFFTLRVGKKAVGYQMMLTIPHC